MPALTPVLQIPYPCPGDLIDSVDFQDFAEAVDAALDANDVLQADLLDRPYVRVDNTGSAQTFTVSVQTDINWTTELEDTDGMWAIGNPERFTVNTAGVYLVTIVEVQIDDFTTLTSQNTRFSRNATNYAGEKKNETTASTNTTVQTLMVCQAGDLIRANMLWTGTGGPGTLFDAEFSAALVCPLV